MVWLWGVAGYWQQRCQSRIYLRISVWQQQSLMVFSCGWVWECILERVGYSSGQSSVCSLFSLNIQIYLSSWYLLKMDGYAYLRTVGQLSGLESLNCQAEPEKQVNSSQKPSYQWLTLLLADSWARVIVCASNFLICRSVSFMIKQAQSIAFSTGSFVSRMLCFCRKVMVRWRRQLKMSWFWNCEYYYYLLLKRPNFEVQSQLREGPMLFRSSPLSQIPRLRSFYCFFCCSISDFMFCLWICLRCSRLCSQWLLKWERQSYTKRCNAILSNCCPYMRMIQAFMACQSLKKLMVCVNWEYEFSMSSWKLILLQKSYQLIQKSCLSVSSRQVSTSRCQLSRLRSWAFISFSLLFIYTPCFALLLLTSFNLYANLLSLLLAMRWLMTALVLVSEDENS